jgi:hypothetical protein
MADVAWPSTLLTQIRLVAGLRWRMARNGLRRQSSRLDLIGVIIGSVFGALLALAAATGFYVGTRFFLAQGKTSWMAVLFWAIFLMWQAFPVFAAGLGGGFEFRTLLRFPLRLSVFYVIGLAYGLSDFSAIASLFCMLAMLAAAASYPAAFAGILVVSLFFILLNVTMERLLGAWFERVFARRRSREVFLAIFVLSMISIQFIVPYLAVLPPSLAGRAVDSSARFDGRGALTALAGLGVYVLIFSGLLLQRFASQYRGEELSEAAAPAALPAAVASRESTDALGFLSGPMSAMIRKEFRYFFRNGFSFLTLLLPPFLVLLFSSQWAGAHPTISKRGLSPEMFFPAMMGYLLLILMAPAYNSFAYESRGMQTYFMAPVRFRHVFLAKNFTLASLIVLEVALAVAVFALRVGLPSTPRLLATLAAIGFVVVGQFAIANWSSLSFPRKLVFGQMRNQRQSGMAVLTAFGVQILFGGISTLLFFAGQWTHNPWLPVEGFLLLSAAAVAGYQAALEPLTKYAEKKKESLIETLCR